MGRLASLTVFGNFIGNDKYADLLAFIRTNSGRLDIDGYIMGCVLDDDGMQAVSYPIDSENPFDLAYRLFGAGSLSTISCSFELMGASRSYDIGLYRDRLVIMITANPVTLCDRCIDFNWHYEIFIPRIRDTFMLVSGVEFSDHW